jgi:hypothetical protein
MRELSHAKYNIRELTQAESIEHVLSHVRVLLTFQLEVSKTQ